MYNLGDLDLFLGEKIQYWKELQTNQTQERKEFIREIAHIRGINSYYESRIKEMAELMNSKYK